MVRYNSRHTARFAIMASIGIVSLFSWGSRVRAEVVASPTQTPVAWMSEWRSSGKSASVSYFSKLLVVKKSSGNFEAVASSDEDGEKTRQDSYLNVPSARHMQLVQSINKVGGKSKCVESIANAAVCMGADTIIDVSGPVWELHFYDAAKSTLKSLVKAPAAANTDYVGWLKAQMAYDGVVLDQKGDLYLAIVPATAIEGESQALSLVGTETKVVLAGGKYPGGGMLYVKARNGNVAILQMIIAKDGSKFEVKPGTKLILESAKKKTQ